MRVSTEEQCNGCGHVEETKVEHLCNVCGKSCASKDAVKYGVPGSFGLIGAVVKGYFFSSVLEDCTAYKFDICEKCLKEMFDKFVIPVEEKEYHIWTGEVHE